MSRPGVLVLCPGCGSPARAGTRFCTRCGGSLATSAAVPPAAPAAPSPSAQPARTGKTGLSIWWIVVLTAFFAFLSRQPIPIAIVAVIGAGLWWLKARPESLGGTPMLIKLRPYAPWAPALQLIVVFVGLGGSAIAVAGLGIVVFLVLRNPLRLVAALEPWWKVQSTIPTLVRKPLAFAIPFVFGYYFGINAGGREWTYTLISVSLGIVVAFLILFTPPDHIRQKARATAHVGGAG